MQKGWGGGGGGVIIAFIDYINLLCETIPESKRGWKRIMCTYYNCVETVVVRDWFAYF